MNIKQSILGATAVATLLLLAVYGYVLVYKAEAQPVLPDNPISATSQKALFDPCGLRDVVCAGEATEAPEIERREAKTTPVERPGDLVTVKSTAFSSVECKTVWCRANAGKPRGSKVALNVRFGKAKAVFVPAFGKTYEVIGTTDHLTDLDFWLGDDQAAALEHGAQYLDVKIIR